MAVLALEHVQIAMPPGGEEAARRFYGEGLGMAEVPKPAGLAGRGGCWFAAGTASLHVGVEAEFRPGRKAHPAFVADVPLAGWRRLHFDDPFGNRVESMETLSVEH